MAPSVASRANGMQHTSLAYKQQAIEIANYLITHGATKAADIAKQLDIPKSSAIVYDNHYGWFQSVSRGVYDLSDFGKTLLNEQK